MWDNLDLCLWQYDFQQVYILRGHHNLQGSSSPLRAQEWQRRARKKASSISTFYRFIVHNGNLCKVTSITELSYLSADENNGINCDFPEIEERERRGPNLLPPVFCISYSLFLGLIPLVPFRLQNIRHCCVIFPLFLPLPTLLELPLPALSSSAFRTPPPLFSWAPTPLSFPFRRAGANGSHASQRETDKKGKGLNKQNNTIASPFFVHFPCLRPSLRGTQREYSSKPLKHSMVERILAFKQ